MANFGPYELLSKLGNGSLGDVHVAQGPEGDPCVLKVLSTELPPIDAAAAARIRHGNLAAVLRSGQLDGRHYIASELVIGKSLQALTKKLKERDGALTPPESCYVVREVALALHELHEATDARGRPLALCHGDVVPQNVLITVDGRVKLTDTGLDKVVLAAFRQRALSEEAIKGRIPYLAPERLKGEPSDRRADVYAAAAVLFELLCGRRLRHAATEAELLSQALSPSPPELRKFAPAMPPLLAAVLERALERNLEDRTPTALLLARELEHFATPEASRQLGARMEVTFELEVEQARARLAPPAGALLTDPLLSRPEIFAHTDPRAELPMFDPRKDIMATASLRAPTPPVAYRVPTKSLRKGSDPKQPEVTAPLPHSEPPRPKKANVAAPLPSVVGETRAAPGLSAEELARLDPPRPKRADVTAPLPSAADETRAAPSAASVRVEPREPAPPPRESGKRPAQSSSRPVKPPSKQLSAQITLVAVATVAALGGLAVGYAFRRMLMPQPQAARSAPESQPAER